MIREMLVSDLDSVLEIENECFTSVYNKEQYRYELEENSCAKLFVLEEDGKIVAFLDYWITFDMCQLSKIAVKNDCRRKGYGKQLMQYMIDDAIEEQCETISLEVRESNITAQKLYESYEFIEINKRKGYYSDNNETAIVMMKAIGGL